MVIYEDSPSAIQISQNAMHHPKTKHIGVEYHFTREKVLDGDVIKLEYCNTADKVADILTKPCHWLATDLNCYKIPEC